MRTVRVSLKVPLIRQNNLIIARETAGGDSIHSSNVEGERENPPLSLIFIILPPQKMQTKGPSTKKLADRRHSGNPHSPNAPFPLHRSQLISTPTPSTVIICCFISVHRSSIAAAHSSASIFHIFPLRNQKPNMSWLFGSSKGMHSKFFSAALRQNYTHDHLFPIPLPIPLEVQLEY